MGIWSFVFVKKKQGGEKRLNSEINHSSSTSFVLSSLSFPFFSKVSKDLCISSHIAHSILFSDPTVNSKFHCQRGIDDVRSAREWNPYLMFPLWSSRSRWSERRSSTSRRRSPYVLKQFFITLEKILVVNQMRMTLFINSLSLFFSVILCGRRKRNKEKNRAKHFVIEDCHQKEIQWSDVLLPMFFTRAGKEHRTFILNSEIRFFLSFQRKLLQICSEKKKNVMEGRKWFI